MKTSAKYPQETIDELIQLYRDGYGVIFLVKKFHMAGKTIVKIFKENGVVLRGLSESTRVSPLHPSSAKPLQVFMADVRKRLCTRYLEKNSTIAELAVEFAMHRNTVKKIIRVDGAWSPPAYREYVLNDRFFKDIDTPEKAYWLGFLFADGCVLAGRSPGLRLGLAATDVQHIEMFRSAIESNHPVSVKTKTLKYRDRLVPVKSAMIDIRSRCLADSLISHGCVPAKTYLDPTPPTLIPELEPHFVRGYFDGDGTICFHERKNRVTKHGTLYVDCNWSVVGSEKVLSAINGILSRHLGFKIANLLHLRGCKRLAFSGPNHILALFYFLYPSAPVICLPRKRMHWERGLILLQSNHGGDRLVPAMRNG